MKTKDYAHKANIATQLSHSGSDPADFFGFVNPPVVHASTVLFPTYEEVKAKDQKYIYARRGTPTSEALENALSELEGAAGTVLFPSGLAAIITALFSVLKAGDHILVTDSCYGPTRKFCSTVLARFGVETEYFSPSIGAEIKSQFKETTRAIFMESPGSLTFEIQDIDAIVAAAHVHGSIRTMIDNTWATPLYFTPLNHGIDMTIMAGTKYLVGHSDAMLGTVSANEASWPDLRTTFGDLGICAGPDDIFLGLRGLRTMKVRLDQHQKTAIELAKWLESRSEVIRVLHPALPSHPDHGRWQKYFCGSSGLFSIELSPVSEAAVAALMNGLNFFGMGFSWGGFESLAIPIFPHTSRTAAPWPERGPMIRIHTGLEDIEDLKRDLEAGFERLNSVG